MHVGEISFCDRIAFNIKSDDAKKYILDHLEKKYGIRIVQKHFEKFNQDKSLQLLQRIPHMVCARSNGNPYFLYLMKYNYSQYCIFIDKKIQQGYYLPRMIIVQLMFDDVMFNDTIFEGEMIKTKDNKWFYLINDMLVCKGRKLEDINLPRRINMIYRTLEENYQKEEYDPFTIGVKEFFRYDQLNYVLLEHIPKLNYTCRGVYFKPLYIKFKDILLNFDDSLVKKVERIKYKDTQNPFITKEDLRENTPSEEEDSSPLETEEVVVSTEKRENTKLLNVRKTATPDVYELLEGNAYIGIACVPSLNISRRLRELTKGLNMVDKIELPFVMSEKFNKWVLM